MAYALLLNGRQYRVCRQDRRQDNEVHATSAREMRGFFLREEHVRRGRDSHPWFGTLITKRQKGIS
jgi:hypothetical protein